MKSGFKYPGAKWSYAKWITSFFPEHKVYLEPFFGSGAAFFNKKPSEYETINDLDEMVVNFFMVCREHPEELARILYFTPFARKEYESVQESKAGAPLNLTGDSIEDARRFAVRCSQGFGSKLADRCGWKNTKHSAGPINARVWGNMPDRIYEIADRLRNAQIECCPAVKLIESYNAEDCLIYADPPYLKETRKSRIYRKEMMEEAEHRELLEVLINHKGPVIVSGYESDLYNELLSGWHKEQKAGRANSTAVRIENLWMNFEPPHNQMHLEYEQKGFFDMGEGEII